MGVRQQRLGELTEEVLTGSGWGDGGWGDGGWGDDCAGALGLVLGQYSEIAPGLGGPQEGGRPGEETNWSGVM
jgi:hypothetical protein